MIDELLIQVQYLMQIQYKNNYFTECEKSNYSWISYRNKKIHLEANDEFMIRQIAEKLSAKQCYDVMKQLNIWSKENQHVDYSLIPKICIDMLSQEENSINLLSETSYNRRRLFLNRFKMYLPDFLMSFFEKITGRKLRDDNNYSTRLQYVKWINK